MKLNKEAQYAILLGTYLSRSGRARIEDVAYNLSISLNFLQNVARKLRVSGVVKAVKGPGGGFSLIGDPTIGEMLKAVGLNIVLNRTDIQAYNTSVAIENRAFGLFADMLFGVISSNLKLPISSLVKKVVAKEVNILDNRSMLSEISS